MTSRRTYGDDEPATEPVPTPTTPARPDHSGLPEGYEAQPYPKVVYHTDGRSKTVGNELDEDTAGGDGFTLDAPPAAAGPSEPK